MRLCSLYRHTKTQALQEDLAAQGTPIGVAFANLVGPGVGFHVWKLRWLGLGATYCFGNHVDGWSAGLDLRLQN